MKDMFLPSPDTSKARRTLTWPSVVVIKFRIGLLFVFCHPSLMTSVCCFPPNLLRHCMSTSSKLSFCMSSSSKPFESRSISPLRCSGDFVSSWQIENLLRKNWSHSEVWLHWRQTLGIHEGRSEETINVWVRGSIVPCLQPRDSPWNPWVLKVPSLPWMYKCQNVGKSKDRKNDCR